MVWPFTFRPQLISSWIKGHQVGRNCREDTELTRATAPFLSFPHAQIEGAHLKALHYAQSHTYVQRRQLTCEHSQEPWNSVELCGRIEKKRDKGD